MKLENMRFSYLAIVTVALLGACTCETFGAQAPADAATTPPAPQTETAGTSHLTGIAFDAPAQRDVRAPMLATCTAFLAEAGRQAFQGSDISNAELFAWTNVRPDVSTARQKSIIESLAKRGYAYSVVGSQVEASQTSTFFYAESKSNNPERIFGVWQTTPTALVLGWGELPVVPKVEPAPPQPGKHVQGWIVATGLGFRGGLSCSYYWFRPDGAVYFGTPNGATSDANFAALQKSEPANCGTYGIVGHEMTLQRNGGKPQKLAWGGGLLGDDVVRGIIYFAAGQKLDGTWETSTSGANISTSATWVFRPDGTFDNGSTASVSDHQRENGKAESNKGTYEFIGNRIRLKFADGSVKAVPIFGTAEKGKPYLLGINGIVYHNVK